jgi:hypothetical protein
MRGQLEASERFLAKAWNWGKSAVHRFIAELIESSMISRVDHLADRRADRFNICNYELYNSERTAERTAERTKTKEGFKEGIKNIVPGNGDRPVNKRLFEIFQAKNQKLPQVKALTADRLNKCRSRINRAERDGRLEQYLKDFEAAVITAQQTPFLRGENERHWQASFDWFIANDGNIYRVLEGKYGSPETEKEKPKPMIAEHVMQDGKLVTILRKASA